LQKSNSSQDFDSSPQIQEEWELLEGTISEGRKKPKSASQFPKQMLFSASLIALIFWWKKHASLGLYLVQHRVLVIILYAQIVHSYSAHSLKTYLSVFIMICITFISLEESFAKIWGAYGLEFLGCMIATTTLSITNKEE
jgi:hypothetical protein